MKALLHFCTSALARTTVGHRWMDLGTGSWAKNLQKPSQIETVCFEFKILSLTLNGITRNFTLYFISHSAVTLFIYHVIHRSFNPVALTPFMFELKIFIWQNDKVRRYWYLCTHPLAIALYPSASAIRLKCI